MNQNTRQQNMVPALNSGRKGFILLYTVLILSVILVTGGIVADTVMKEVAIARDEAESLKAFYAADAGVECARYFSEYRAFDPMTPEDTYDCGLGGVFTAGGDGAGGVTTDCEARTYTFTLSNFSNGACAEVEVRTVPQEVNAGGMNYICYIHVVSSGRNTCTPGSKKLVERTRWEIY